MRKLDQNGFKILLTMRKYRHFQLCLGITCAVYLGMVFVFHNRLQIDIGQQLQQSDFFTSKDGRHVTFANAGNNTFYKAKARVNKKILEVNFDRHKIKQTDTDKVPVERSNPLSQFQECYSNSNQMKFHILEDKNIFLYSAYLDQRYQTAYIRLMVIMNKNRKKNVKLFCHFQNGISPIIESAQPYEMCENHNKKFGGYIFSCAVPHFTKHLCEITITSDSSETSESEKEKNEVILEVTHILPQKASYEYGICVPPLFGNIKPEELVEFIELTHILGADHFIFYDFDIESQNVRKVLDYYIRKGMVTLVPWKMPVDITDGSIWYHGQLISHNDCLYRAMSTIKHLSINDIDEYIIPHNNFSNWRESFSHLLLKNQTCGLSFESVFYDPGVAHDHPSGLLTMGHTARTKLTSKVRTKVLVKPSKIFEVGIHHVSKPVAENYAMHSVNPSIAYLHHYRKCVANYGMKCKFEKDTSMFQYLDELKMKFDLARVDIHIAES